MSSSPNPQNTGFVIVDKFIQGQRSLLGAGGNCFPTFYPDIELFFIILLRLCGSKKFGVSFLVFFIIHKGLLEIYVVHVLRIGRAEMQIEI